MVCSLVAGREAAGVIQLHGNRVGTGWLKVRVAAGNRARAAAEVTEPVEIWGVPLGDSQVINAVKGPE